MTGKTKGQNVSWMHKKEKGNKWLRSLFMHKVICGMNEEMQPEEFVVHYDQNCSDQDIRLLCSSKAKDRPQAEEEDENLVLDETKQLYTV